MEDIELSTEQAIEEMNEKAQHGGSRWIMGVALTSALLAAFAAVAALLSSHHTDEAVIDQIRASDQWSYYQAKGIKRAVREAQVEFLKSVGKEVPAATEAKLAQYDKDQEDIKRDAEEKERSARVHLEHHAILSRAVTLFQVSIAVAAIAVLTRRRTFWFVSMGFGAIGLFFFLQGLLLHFGG
jgi:hypothetical protein